MNYDWRVEVAATDGNPLSSYRPLEQVLNELADEDWEIWQLLREEGSPIVVHVVARQQRPDPDPE